MIGIIAMSVIALIILTALMFWRPIAQMYHLAVQIAAIDAAESELSAHMIALGRAIHHMHQVDARLDSMRCGADFADETKIVPAKAAVAGALNTLSNLAARADAAANALRIARYRVEAEPCADVRCAVAAICAVVRADAVVMRGI